MRKPKIVGLISLLFLSSLLFGDQVYEFNKKLAEGVHLLYSINTGKTNFYDDGVVFKNEVFFIGSTEKDANTNYCLCRLNPERKDLSSKGLDTGYKIGKESFFINRVPMPIPLKTRLFSYNGISKNGDKLDFLFINKGFKGDKRSVNTTDVNLFNFIKVSGQLVLVTTMEGNNLNFFVLTSLVEKPVHRFSTQIDEQNLVPFRACYHNGFLYLLCHGKEEEKSVIYSLDMTSWDELKKIKELDSYFSLYPAIFANGSVIVGLDNRIIVIADSTQAPDEGDVEKGFEKKLRKKGNIAVNKDEKIIVTFQNSVAMLDNNLDLQWNFLVAGEPSRVTLDDDGAIYFGDSAGNVYGLNEEGKKIFAEKIQTVKSSKELTREPQPFTAGPVLFNHYLVMNSRDQVNVLRMASQR